jgi:putative DNA primase/helicase
MIAPQISIQDNPENLTPENIPDELKRRRQWIVWRYETSRGTPTKIPYSAQTGTRAKSTDLETWAYFEDALDAYRNGRYDGVGFVFSSGDPYTGIDLDHVVSDSGEITEEARAIMDALGGYQEYSPSGTGVHIIIRGELRKDANHRSGGWLEVYSERRFFTITGEVI